MHVRRANRNNLRILLSDFCPLLIVPRATFKPQADCVKPIILICSDAIPKASRSLVGRHRANKNSSNAPRNVFHRFSATINLPRIPGGNRSHRLMIIANEEKLLHFTEESCSLARSTFLRKQEFFPHYRASPVTKHILLNWTPKVERHFESSEEPRRGTFKNGLL